MALTRRQLPRGSAGAGLGLQVAGAAQSLRGAMPGIGKSVGARRLGGFGPLLPDPDRILDLPSGFSYRVVTQAGRPAWPERNGRPLAGASGSRVVPGRPDGMAAFAGPTAAPSSS